MRTLFKHAAGALAALALAGPASATALLTNLIVNPDAETGAAANNFGSTVAPTGWTTSSSFTAVTYAAGGAIDLNTADSIALGGGNAYFAGGVDNGSSTARQRIAIGDLGASIDAGLLTAALSGLIGGFSSQEDNLVIEALFLDQGESAISSLSIGPATAAARSNESTLLSFSDNSVVPVGTRFIDIVMTSTRAAGSYNDGYADNLSFVLRGQVIPNPVPLPGTVALVALGLAGLGLRRGARR